MIIYTDWLNRDNREYYACLRYILFRCCKSEVVSDDEGNATRIYKPIDFMDMKWIIDRCNYLKGKKFNLDFINSRVDFTNNILVYMIAAIIIGAFDVFITIASVVYVLNRRKNVRY